MNAQMRARACRVAAVAVLAALQAMAWASPPSVDPGPAGNAGATSTSTRGAVGLGEVVDDDALAGLSGGEAALIVSVDNRGTVSGNSASDLVSGDNLVSDGAFANAAGLSTVIQNSGANVLIQNGTSVNVRFGGPGP